MGIFDDVEYIVKRQRVLFFLVCTSSTMSGTKICAVNCAIRDVLPEMKDAADIDLKVAVLTFSRGCRWMYPVPISAESFCWQELNAKGEHDLGSALLELNRKLSRNEFLASTSGNCAPVIFLMTDGKTTDDFESALSALIQNNWFKHAIKLAVAIGDGADKGELIKFTENIETFIDFHNPCSLKELIRKAYAYEALYRDYMVEAPAPEYEGDWITFSEFIKDFYGDKYTMNKEIYPNRETKEKSFAAKIQAKVILAKCPYAYSKSDNLFGMRIQKFGSDWKRTWAFKIDAERAHHEGYDKERSHGTFDPTAEYPGCPYCGTISLAQCACGKSFCFKTEGENRSRTMRLTCPWCGHTGEYNAVETLDLQGGGM